MQEARRVAIIGCGYVGTALGESLAQVGHDVVGTTTTQAGAQRLRATAIKPRIVNVQEIDELHQTLSDRDAVFLTIAPRVRGADYRDVYLTAATNLTEATDGTPVRRIVYTSSTRVYAQSDGSWVDEESPTESADENGRVLLEAEGVLLRGKPRRLKPAARGRVLTSVVRLSGIYGPRRDPVERIKGSAGTRRDDGDVYVNMIHRDDLVTALAALLGVDHHGVLNLSDDHPLTRRDYYDRVLADLHLEPIRWGEADAPRPRGKRIRNERIKKLLNLTMRHPTHCRS